MPKLSHKINMKFQYSNAAATDKPGYLKAKFDKERKRLADAAKAAPVATVRSIQTRRKG